MQDRLHFPMVTVCPLRPDLDSLSFHLLDNNHRHVSEGTADDLANAAAEIIRGEQFNRRKPTYS